MTREEAIKKLKYCKSVHNGSFGDVLKIAIHAVERDYKIREILNRDCTNITKFVLIRELYENKAESEDKR